MPLIRSPPGNLVRGPLEPASEQPPQGAVASALGTLPLDADIAISPTLILPPGNTRSKTKCIGGPGNTICGMEVRDEEMGVECDICGAWSHAACQKMSKTAYNALNRHKKVFAFICHACRQRTNFSDIQVMPTMSDASVQAPSDETEQLDQSQTKGCQMASAAGAPITSDASVQVLTDELAPKIPDNQAQTKDISLFSHLEERIHMLESSIKEHINLLAESQRPVFTMDKGQQQTFNPSQQGTYADAVRYPTARNTRAHSGPQQPVQPNMHGGAGKDQHMYTTNNDYRHIVRAELREMEERRKRASTLVVRGLRVGSAREAVARFSEIASSLIGEQVSFTEVCRVKSDVDLFRGNVHDSRVRKRILDNAKHLRQSANSHVFIRRDLTFQQREELRARYPPRSLLWEQNRSLNDQTHGRKVTPAVDVPLNLNKQTNMNDQTQHRKSGRSQHAQSGTETLHQSHDTVPKRVISAPNSPPSGQSQHTQSGTETPHQSHDTFPKRVVSAINSPEQPTPDPCAAPVAGGIPSADLSDSGGDGCNSPLQSHDTVPHMVISALNSPELPVPAPCAAFVAGGVPSADLSGSGGDSRDSPHQSHDTVPKRVDSAPNSPELPAPDPCAAPVAGSGGDSDGSSSPPQSRGEGN